MWFCYDMMHSWQERTTPPHSVKTERRHVFGGHMSTVCKTRGSTTQLSALVEPCVNLLQSATVQHSR